jgi:two-component system, OmpR family, sensor histidine kinase CreC
MIRLVVVALASIGIILLVAFFANRLVRIPRRGLSIRMQVFIALAFVIGAFAFGLGLMVLDRIEARSVRFATQAAAEKAGLIAQLLGSELQTYGPSLQEIASHLRTNAPTDWLHGVSVQDEQGNVLWSPNTPQKTTPRVFAEAKISSNGRPVGTVRVVEATVAIRGLLADFAPTVLVISLLLGATAALSALWIGRTIAGPIEELTRFASSVSAGENPSAPHLTAGREVTRLTQSIDSMRRQLQGRPFVEAFAADLSHELKNPVAAIRAAAEVLDDSALEEPEEGRRFVRRIQEAVARIERLLGELLSLARIEARGIEELDVVQLEPLIKASLQHLPADRRVQLNCDGGCVVRGDTLWLGRAISNLINNAVVHSSTGEIGVQLVRDPSTQTVSLRVSNRGRVDRHTQGRLFGRFVTTRADRGGTGLGLAIVRAVAEAHRGHVELETAGPPDVRFALTLPLA